MAPPPLRRFFATATAIAVLTSGGPKRQRVSPDREVSDAAQQAGTTGGKRTARADRDAYLQPAPRAWQPRRGVLPRAAPHPAGVGQVVAVARQVREGLRPRGPPA